MRRALLAVVLGCGSSGQQVTAPPKGEPPPSQLSAALMPLAWWLGDWKYEGADATEHWIAAGGAIYGVGLSPTQNGFTIMIVDDGDGPGPPDGILRYIANLELAGGQDVVESRKKSIERRRIVFANDGRDFPQTIGYRLEDDNVLHLELFGNGQSEDYRLRSTGSPSRAPELEAADRAFSADTGARGIAGWTAAFHIDGWMMRDSKRFGVDTIPELMGPVLAHGRLAWAPLASGVAGSQGFTVGTATYTAAKPEDSWRSSYVTIWMRQPDKSWKVRFYAARRIQE